MSWHPVLPATPHLLACSFMHLTALSLLTTLWSLTNTEPMCKQHIKILFKRFLLARIWDLRADFRVLCPVGLVSHRKEVQPRKGCSHVWPAFGPKWGTDLALSMVQIKRGERELAQDVCASFSPLKCFRWKSRGKHRCNMVFTEFERAPELYILVDFHSVFWSWRSGQWPDFQLGRAESCSVLPSSVWKLIQGTLYTNVT